MEVSEDVTSFCSCCHVGGEYCGGDRDTLHAILSHVYFTENPITAMLSLENDR